MAGADHLFVDFAILMNQFIHYNAYMDPLHFLDEAEILITDTVTSDINYNMLIGSYGRKKKTGQFSKKRNVYFRHILECQTKLHSCN